jgi:hypothetical protein
MGKGRGGLAMKKEYWRQTKIADIKSISGIGGRFGRDDLDIYFAAEMKDGNHHFYHYDSRKAYDERNELFDLFIECNHIPETYRLENEMNIQVDGVSVPFGCRVEGIKGDYQYKTFLELDELRKENKILNDGWRHAVYICLFKIEVGIVHDKLTSAYREQLKALEIEFKEEGHG